MSVPHLSSKLPWEALMEHFQYNSHGPRDFRIRQTSKREARHKAILDFAHALASRISQCAETQMSNLPTWSEDDWRAVGVVDGDLFSSSLIPHIGLQDLDYRLSSDLKSCDHWRSFSTDSSQAVDILLSAPENPFTHLPALIYLARHTRFSMSASLRGMHEFDPTHAPHGNRMRPRPRVLDYYLFLNLNLALDSGAVLDVHRLATFRHRVDGAFEQPHHEFWSIYNHPPPSHDSFSRYKTGRVRAVYNRRCFRILVALYALHKEAYIRDWALGLTFLPRFEETELVHVILYELENISSAFRLDSNFWQQVPTLLINAGRSQATVKCGDSHDTPLSHFLDLPVELLLHIASFLPSHSLLSMTGVCRQTRSIYISLAYADPFSLLVPDEHFDLQVDGRLHRVSEMMNSRPYLSMIARSLRVILPAVLDEGSAGTHLPLPTTLPEELQELHVYLPIRNVHGAADDSLEITPHSPQDIYALSRHFPHVSRLNFVKPLEYWANTDPEWGTARPTADEGKPLQVFTCLDRLKVNVGRRPLYPDVYRHVISSSASHLTSLVLVGNDLIGDISSFPICRHVRQLRIMTDLEPRKLEAVIYRCFPSINSLCGPEWLDLMRPNLFPYLADLYWPWLSVPRAFPTTMRTLSLSGSLISTDQSSAYASVEAVYIKV
ncbi:hypothetical protein CPB85DRAFT_1442192 [Mucidula mucida]|nr:hypothetical protein CPB85DRAFT_1442192 [Mucidula mucida]